MYEDDEDGAATVTWRMESTFDKLARTHPNLALQPQPQPAATSTAATVVSTPSPASKRRRSASNPFTLPIAIHWERGKEKRERRQRSAEKRKAALIAAGALKQQQQQCDAAVEEEDKENSPLTAAAAASIAASALVGLPSLHSSAQPATSTTPLPASPSSFSSLLLAQPGSVAAIGSSALRLPSNTPHILPSASQSSPPVISPSLSTSTSFPPCSVTDIDGSVTSVQSPVPPSAAFEPNVSSHAAVTAGGLAHANTASFSLNRPRLPVRSLTRVGPAASVVPATAASVPTSAAVHGSSYHPPTPSPSIPPAQPPAHHSLTYHAASSAQTPNRSFSSPREPPPPLPTSSAPARPIQTASYPYSASMRPSLLHAAGPSPAALPTAPLPSHHPLPAPTAPTGSSHYHYHYSSRPTHAQLNAQQPRASVPAAALTAAATRAQPQPARVDHASHRPFPSPRPQPAAKLQPHLPPPPLPTATAAVKHHPLPLPAPNQYRPVVKQEHASSHPSVVPSPSTCPNPTVSAVTGTADGGRTSTGSRSSFFTDDDDEDALMALSQAYDTISALQ